MPVHISHSSQPHVHRYLSLRSVTHHHRNITVGFNCTSINLFGIRWQLLCPPKLRFLSIGGLPTLFFAASRNLRPRFCRSAPRPAVHCPAEHPGGGVHLHPRLRRGHAPAPRGLRSHRPARTTMSPPPGGNSPLSLAEFTPTIFPRDSFFLIVFTIFPHVFSHLYHPFTTPSHRTGRRPRSRTRTWTPGPPSSSCSSRTAASSRPAPPPSPTPADYPPSPYAFHSGRRAERALQRRALTTLSYALNHHNPCPPPFGYHAIHFLFFRRSTKTLGKKGLGIFHTAK